MEPGTKSTRTIVLFAVGSALAIEYVETCRRRGDAIIAGIANHPAPHSLGDRLRIFDVKDIPGEFFSAACLVPLFTPSNRILAVAEATRLGFDFSLALVDPTAIIASDLALGGGSFINAGAIIGAGTAIGRQVVVNRGASIGHHVRIDDFASLGPGAILAGNVEIGESAMIGAGAIVQPGISIGARAIVGAGAIVTKSVPPGARMLGVPAKPAADSR